jgi:hypothetical protein
MLSINVPPEFVLASKPFGVNVTLSAENSRLLWSRVPRLDGRQVLLGHFRIEILLGAESLNRTPSKLFGKLCMLSVLPILSGEAPLGLSGRAFGNSI